MGECVREAERPSACSKTKKLITVLTLTNAVVLIGRRRLLPERASNPATGLSSLSSIAVDPRPVGDGAGASLLGGRRASDVQEEGRRQIWRVSEKRRRSWCFFFPSFVSLRLSLAGWRGARCCLRCQGSTSEKKQRK